MSSTKRGGKRSEADFYRTPSWVSDRLFEFLTLPSGCWLEPGVGEGDLVKAVHARVPGVKFTGLDIRKTKFIGGERSLRDAVNGDFFFVGDFLCPDPENRFEKSPTELALRRNRFDVAFENPPFSLALQFIQRSLKLADHVVALLRLNYLGAHKRTSFMQQNTPDVYVIPDRVSFTRNGKTDSIEYAWMHWISAKPQTSGKLVVLNSTPKEIRCAD